MNYSQKYLEHFSSPRNIGEIEQPDALVEVEHRGGGCFDRLRVTLKLDHDRIGSILFKARACSGTIAAASAATEWATGKTAEEASRLDPETIAKYLDGVPEKKQHSIELAAEAIRKAALQGIAKLKILKVIAIDGPAGVGKSTTAKGVAKRLGWQYIDTGAMYRALALAVLDAGFNPMEAKQIEPVILAADITLVPGDPVRVLLNDADITEKIRTPEVSDAASKVSVHHSVRRKLVELQRALGLQKPCVLEGRDIGTVVFPDAGLKIYLDASVEERARRRMKDYKAQHHPESIDDVIAEIQIRDKRDKNRIESPLTIAEDAVVLDTTGMDLQRQIEAVLTIAKERFRLQET